MFHLFASAADFEGIERALVILQACYDLIPVALFLIGSIIMLRDFYNKMVKGCYVLLASGTIMVVAAGLMKALHKMLIGVASLNYTILSQQFVSTQSVGFFLILIAFIGMFTTHNTKYTKVNMVALPALVASVLALEDIHGITEYTNGLPFIVMMIVGAAGFLIMMIVVAAKMKSPVAIVLFGVAIVMMVAMGYLSTRDGFDANWIAISTNIVYQGSFLAGCILLHKKGLGAEDALAKKN